MALTKTSRVPVAAATSCSAGGTVNGTVGSVNYGVSGVATITNGTAPATPCGLYLDYSPDGGSTWYPGPLVGLADTVGSSVTLIAYSLGIGAGGDWTHYRPRFTGNTGQAVTVEAEDSSTTSL